MKIKYLAASFVLLLSLILSGCEGIVFNLSFGEHVLVSGRTTKLMQDECNLILMNYQTGYNLYYEKMGSTDFWEETVGDGDFSDYLRDGRFREELCMLVLLNDMASSLSVKLSEEEKELCAQAARGYYSGLTQEEITFFQGNAETVESVYQKYRVAQRVIDVLSDGALEEISDNDKRVILLQIIATDEQSDILQAKARIDSGEDFETVAKEYSRLSQIEYQVSRGKLNPELDKQAFYMRDGEISQVIETEQGYYLLKCINDFEESLSELNESVMFEKQRFEIWKSSFEAYADKHKTAISTEIWQQLKFRYTSTMRHANLFDVYDRFFP